MKMNKPGATAVVWTRRKSRKIRAWFVERGITIRAVAEELGVCDSLVHRTISGKCNNRRVLRKLLEMKVPEKYLDLPEDLRVKEEEVA